MPIPQLRVPEPTEEQKPWQRSTSSSQPASAKPGVTHLWRRTFAFAALGVLLTFALLVANVFVAGGRVLGGNGNVSIFEQIRHLLTTPDRQLRGEVEDRINILLLGIGGPGHDGPLLADTIIVASFKPSTKEVGFVSVPRDLVVPFPKYEWRKINHALAFGEQLNYPGGGDALMREMVELVTGLPIHYQARVDFTGFQDIVDDVGGVDVYVDRSFVDPQYPTEDYGYQTVRFTAGFQQMDGERALEYVRSRYGSAGEGSDFARSKRQQKVLLAIKAKSLSFGTLINPKRISDAFTTLGQHVSTNLELWEMLRFGTLVEGVTADRIVNRVLDASPGSPLVASTSAEGGYILQPRSGDFQEIHFLAENLFTLARATKEGARIAIENGTSTPGLAQQIADELKRLDYEVVRVAQAKSNDYDRTIIYDASGGTKPYTLESLRERLGAEVTGGLPTFYELGSAPGESVASDGRVAGAETSQFDIVIILGSDQQQNAPIAGSKLPKTPLKRPTS